MLSHLSKEEQANTWTHLVATIATLAVAYPLIRIAYQSPNLQLPITNHQLAIAGIILFLLGMLFMYLSSTLYHAVTHPVHKWRLRIMDHIAIYVMIAGSYSPICISVLGGWMGWTLFGFLWACVVAGIIGKVVALGKHPNLSLALYLAMGWAALLVIIPLWKHMSHVAFAWILGEGIAYTIGAYFFHHDEETPFYHAIWHVFIMLGSLCHTIALFLFFQA